MKSIVRFSICLLLLTISFGVSSVLAVDKGKYAKIWFEEKISWQYEPQSIADGD